MRCEIMYKPMTVSDSQVPLEHHVALFRIVIKVIKLKLRCGLKCFSLTPNLRQFVIVRL